MTDVRDLAHGPRAGTCGRYPAAAHLPLHGRTRSRRDDRRRRGRRARLVHGAAPPVASPATRWRSCRSRARPAPSCSASARPLGYFAAAVAAALVLAAVPRSLGGRARSSESAVIGTVQAFALACGALFVSLYGGFLNGLTNLLFGIVPRHLDRQVLALLVVAVVALAVLAVDRQAAALRHRRSGRGRRPRRAGAAARDRLPCPAGLRGGRGQPDHRRAARVRAARDARRDRPATHGPPAGEPADHDRDRAADGAGSGWASRTSPSIRSASTSRPSASPATCSRRRAVTAPARWQAVAA